MSAIGPENKNPFALVDPDIDGYRKNQRPERILPMWN